MPKRLMMRELRNDETAIIPAMAAKATGKSAEPEDVDEDLLARGYEAEHGAEQEHAGKAVEQRQPVREDDAEAAGNRLNVSSRRYWGGASRAGGRRPRG